MTQFTVTIDSPAHLAGITAARDARNASLPQTIPDPNDAEQQIPNPDLIATDEAYVQFVMTMAAESYARQHNT